MNINIIVHIYERFKIGIQLAKHVSLVFFPPWGTVGGCRFYRVGYMSCFAANVCLKPELEFKNAELCEFLNCDV